MGAYIVSLAYNHNLDITSDKKFAEDISKRFSANLTMLLMRIMNLKDMKYFL